MEAAGMTTTLDLILSKAAIRADNILDRLTDKAEEVLGSKKRVTQKTIWAVGDFPKPWASDSDEIAAINGGEWFPSTKDFIAAIMNSGARGSTHPTVGHTESFINLVFMQPKGSIARINFVTHGASTEIGLKGRIEPGAVFFDEGMEAGILEGFKNNGILKDDGTVVPWSEIRARFAKDAVIVVYACKAALSEAFLQDLADIFGVTVQGFTKKLQYTYDAAALSGGKIDRHKLKVDGQSDITKLTPDITKSPSAQAPPP
jgi:hypothetical protein